MVISKLPGAITCVLTIDKGLKQSTIGKVILQLKSSFCYFMLRTKKSVTSFFLSDFHDFLPKCRVLYVVLEKGHGASEKGHGAREKGHGVAPC